MPTKVFIGLLLILLLTSCGIVKITPLENSERQPLPTQLNAVPAPVSGVAQAEPTSQPTATPEGGAVNASQVDNQGGRLPRHGLKFALLYPLLFFGIPWLILEIFIIRYVQPRGVDVADVRIKAQDGLFLEAIVSMTARRTLTLASTRMTWPRVRGFVEKTIEQELIHAATNFPTLEDLERNLKVISDSFSDLPIVRTLSRDFGLEVLWFNIEITYPQETMDALNRKAEASAGGTAYLAYAAAAHLDPDTPEARELYKVFQVTSGRVDAARNLGGGLSGLVDLLGRRSKAAKEAEDESPPNA